MSLYNNISLAQARKDLQYLKDNYGEPQDFCGSFCNTEVLQYILMGKQSIKEVIIDYISYYFSNSLQRDWRGCCSWVYPDKEDKHIQKIIERYHID